jgi:hypothetical protein
MMMRRMDQTSYEWHEVEYIMFVMWVFYFPQSVMKLIVTKHLRQYLLNWNLILRREKKNDETP